MLLESISQRTRVPKETLQKIASSASRRYKVYTIPKRTGGTREISHPSRSLKAVQRWLARNLLTSAPVHSAATAYEKGLGIRENASRHAGTAYTLRMDFKDFFPSFDAQSIILFLNEIKDRQSLILTDEDIQFATQIFCKDGKLTIGAPSSPKITNAMMFDLDNQIDSVCRKANVIYTRYADDLFFSGFEKNLLKATEIEIRDIVSKSNRPKLFFNDDKTLHLSRAAHRSITGLVITPRGLLSIGRERKRKVKTLMYLAINGNINPVDRGYLAGMIAFAHDVEPAFVASLSKKFQIDVLQWAKNI